MNHLSEEQLILHYYGESDEGEAAADALATERHLEACGECRGLYHSLQRVLNVVDGLPAPELGAEYGAQVWQRIERKLGARRRFLPFDAHWRWVAAAAACTALMLIAFAAGRYYPGTKSPVQLAARDSQDGERVLLVAVGDYLERSQMVLIELANASPKGSMDITEEQLRAADLVTETRLYRQTAERTGDTRITSVLDDLERVLMDIRNAPSNMTNAQLEELRRRLEAEGILFKIRVLGSNVRSRENTETPAPRQAL
ncbi:MAG: hypothetical protein ABI759_07225 [Candidatus Solibacter sp.]